MAVEVVAAVVKGLRWWWWKERRRVVSGSRKVFGLSISFDHS